MPHHRSAAASRHGHHRSAAVDALLADAGGNAVEELGATSDLQLPAATTAPAAAPASVADQPPLAARENFAFAPYWTLTQSPLFDLTGLSTLDYFAVGVNPDGSLDESGPGWDGFESQDLSDLITRAHEAGERVVLTVNDFDQGSLDTLTSSPTAAATLSSALIPLLQAKSLDGVNFDFEGDGSGDQAGLTSLIQAVSGALRAADPHWQITMDTYASSAGDADGFYDIPALAPFVDAFFVMDYELNLAGAPSGASPLTSGAFSSLTTLKQYTSVVPASKVILGLPFFGIDWPTDNGTMAADGDRRGQRHRGVAGPGQRSRVLGPGHRDGMDELPGRQPVARVVLRRRVRAVRGGPDGRLLRRAWRGHLGPGHGERRGAADRGTGRNFARRAGQHRPGGHVVQPGRRAGAGAGARPGHGVCVCTGIVTGAAPRPLRPRRRDRAARRTRPRRRPPPPRRRQRRRPRPRRCRPPPPSTTARRWC